MPSLYVANCSKQHHDFLYRIPETMQVKLQHIRAGEQARIGNREFTIDQIEKVVADHRPYGLIPAQAVKNAKTFIGLCYSIDKPLTLDTILAGFGNNDDVLKDVAERRREDVAEKVVATIASTMRQVGVDVPQAEVSIVEDTQGGKPPSISKGYEAVAPGRTARHDSRPSKRR